MIPRLGRCLGAIALLLIALQLLYVSVANVLLNHDALRQRLALAVPTLSLEWSSARSWFPGHLHLERLDIDIQLPDRHLALSLEDARLRLALWPLLTRRMHVESLVASRIHEVVIDDYRITGEGDLHVVDLRWARGEVAAERLRLSVETGMLSRDDAAMVESIRLDTELHLAPLTLAEHPGGDALRFFSGYLEVTGESDAYDVFNHYLTELGWLEISGHGALEGRLEIEHGRLMHGSALRLDSPALGVILDESELAEGGQRYRLTGAGNVEARIEHDETQLALSLDDMLMQRDDLLREAMRGNGFRLTLATPALALHAPPRELHRASFAWDAAELVDTTALNHYLPDTLPMRFGGGSALLHGRLAYRDEILQGDFTLEGDDVTVHWGDTPVIGQLDLQLAIAELDPRALRLDLSGTRLALRATTQADDLQPLITELDFSRARFHSPPSDDAPDQTPRGHVSASLDANAFNVDAFNADAFNADIRASGRVANLDVLDVFFSDVLDGRGLALEGGGEFDAALRLENGVPQPGSHLSVDAPGLGSRFLDFHARGDGQIHASVEANDDESGDSVSLVAMQVILADVDLHRRSDSRRLFHADRLTLRAIGDTPSLGQALREPHLDIAWRNARIPNVGVLNAYLPHEAPLSIDSGTATTNGRVSVAERRAWGDARLTGDAIAGRVLGNSVDGQLDLSLALRDANLADGRLDLSGTRLALQASSVGEASQRLVSRLIARRAHLVLDIDASTGDERGPTLSSAALQIDGSLADIGLINGFLPEEHGLEVSGAGRFRADLALEGERLAPGSHLRIDSQGLLARFLHYEAQGDGTLEIEASGTPDALAATLRLRLPHFDLSHRERRDERVAGRHLAITSQARHLDRGIDRRTDWQQGLHGLQTHIDLPIVEVPDLAAFNAYLPEDAGIALLSGSATLATELHLDGMVASGQLRLDAFDARLSVEDQVLRGSLSLDTRLNDGDLERMEFDASGSRVALRNVALEDTVGNSISPGWRATLDLEEARLIWQRPLTLEARLALAMRDSGLLVNLFVDAARERRWLRDLLTIRDVRGVAQVAMNDDSLVLRDLAIHGNGLELLAHLRFHDERLNGAMYGRHGRLALGIGLRDGERQWHWWRPRRWFESTRIPLPTADDD